MSIDLTGYDYSSTTPTFSVSNLVGSLMKRLKPLLGIFAVFMMSHAPSNRLAAEATDVEPAVKIHLEEGDSLRAFRVEKVAGAEEDGVEPGQVLCYRCRYGSSPMVLVFAQQNSEDLLKLTKQMDQWIESYEVEKMRGLVTFFGTESPELIKAAEELAGQLGQSAVPIVVAEDAMQGPIGYRLSKEDEITVVIAVDSQIATTLVGTADKIDLEAIAANVKSMLSLQE